MTRKIKIAISIMSVVLVALIALVGGIYWWISCRAPQDAMVYIYPDSDVTEAVDSACHSSVYASRVATVLRMIPHKADSFEGAYKVEAGAPAYLMAWHIANHRQSPVNFTFNNIRTVDELAERAAHSLMMSKADFLAAATDTAMRFTQETLPAAFIPDTYNCYWNITPEKLMQKLRDRYNAVWNADRRAKAAALNLTPVQVATLASIVEEETNRSDERPMVARLYLNRLEKKMPLQADPTVKFALGDFARKRILKADLAVESPYNTYRNHGLPPGPIRIVEVASIDAVLNAPEHDYLYMCASADFSGRHKFATSLAEHNANAALYRKALNDRGITH